MEKIDVKQNPQQDDEVEDMQESSQTKGNINKGMDQAKSEKELSDPQAVGEQKVAENNTNSLKKAKQSSMQINKPKNTVPRPFSLATEKRMMNMDRLRSSDVVKPPKPTLTKSTSLNYKILARSALISDKRSDQKLSILTRPPSKPSLKQEARTDKQVNKKVEKDSAIKNNVEAKTDGKKIPQVTVKEGKDLGSNSKLRKSSTFKALPLPSFYHRDLPPRPEAKKTPVTHSKPTMFGQISKHADPKSNSNKTVEDQKPKRVTRASSFSASETRKSCLRSTREVTKSVVTCA